MTKKNCHKIKLRFQLLKHILNMTKKHTTKRGGLGPRFLSRGYKKCGPRLTEAAFSKNGA